MGRVQELFSDRTAVIATMHYKEKVIAPLLEQELGIKTIVPQNFDTDIFGTFTREVKRLGTQIAAAKLKAEKALEITGEKLAIASEGSFHPHPALPYLSANREIVILLDKINNLEIIGEEFSLETNFNHQVISSLDEAYEFAEKIGFPQHGLVLMYENSISHQSEIIKGINTKAKLTELVELALTSAPEKTVHLETDMRALYNPTRMNNIAKATQNLLNKINSCCPQCQTPGFEITERIPGLPCEICHTPTTLIYKVLYECHQCGFTEEKLFPHGDKFADPAQCMYCNP
ncbi:DUF6671 family protein [Nostoc sp. CMAA1605]|uniref:DUF6671 family protein n=1 Tax=Nostoc sp. CMAA1605 TaxID=2055159 RepID=UPI001F4523D5|nr:DUF6671 family protein [Nostoc sp. CMAA1605]MCF4970521.1 hypothetical protein [Nostoc sp. CMAA1605]